MRSPLRAVASVNRESEELLTDAHRRVLYIVQRDSLKLRTDVVSVLGFPPSLVSKIYHRPVYSDLAKKFGKG